MGESTKGDDGAAPVAPPQKKQDKDLAKIDRVVKELTALRDDELFQMDLKDPMCLEAIEYWTTAPEKRKKDAQSFAAIQENYKVQAVFQKLKKLQHACRQIPMGVPMKAVLAGKIDPLYGIERPAPNPSPRPVSPQQTQDMQKSSSRLDTLLALSRNKVVLWWTVQIGIILLALRLYDIRLL